MKIAIVEFSGASGAADFEYCYGGILKQDVVRVWHQEESLPKGIDLLIVPGGASYGDYLRPGGLAKASTIAPLIRKFAQEKGLVLGVGNGFQILCEIEVLPGALLVNSGMKFLNHDPYVMVENTQSPFLKNFDEGEIIRLPLSCYYGRYYCNRRALRDLQEEERIALRYCDKYGDVDEENPFNGCISSIAGITNRHKNVLGIMSHPERLIESWLGSDLGLKILGAVIEPKA